MQLEGHTAFEATDGLSGLQAVHDHAPDVIFCDVMMPHMDGVELLGILQKENHFKNIPFIFLSANAEPEKIAEAINLGAKDYIIKPFVFSKLKAVLQKNLYETFCKA